MLDFAPIHEGAQQVVVISNDQLVRSPRISRNALQVPTTLESYTGTLVDLPGQGLNAPTHAGTMPMTGLGQAQGHAYGPGGYLVPLYPGGGWAWVRKGSPFRPPS